MEDPLNQMSGTKKKIMDSAEKLFASKGYHNTSLRELTSAAKVNLAAVNYHFGSKEALIEQIFERRLLPLNRIREQRLDAIVERARESNRLPLVEEILRAFMEPVIQFREEEPGAGAFITLVGRTMSEPDERLREILMAHFRPQFFKCYEILCQALPHLDKNVLFWRLQFAIGAMSHAFHMIEARKILPEGVVPEYDGKKMADLIVSFATSGMEAE